jgi:hypothetical protein
MECNQRIEAITFLPHDYLEFYNILTKIKSQK